jgi:membrane-bound lytic murein transglycosylase D
LIAGHPIVRSALRVLAAAAVVLGAAACTTLPTGGSSAPSTAAGTAAPAQPPAAAEAAMASNRPAADALGSLIAQSAPAPAPASAANAAPSAPAAANSPAARSAVPSTGNPSATAPARAAAPDPLGALIDASRSAAAEPARAPEPSTPVVAVVPQIDVWERIRRGFAIPDLETPLAANRTQWYASQPDYMERMTQRASRFLFHIVEEIEKRGMPTELALLPFVESAMQPEAVSSAKAAGLWQFIPSTGKLYSLEQNLWHDQRRDIVESTRAALDYLQKLHGDFGDWHLALAAYNWGEGAVGRAIARNRAQRKPTHYTALRMPTETAHYVPKLQAIKNIVRDPARYGITLPAIRNEPYFVAVSKTRDIDVDTAARLAEMPIDEFRALNPSFNRPVIIGAAQPTLLLPADRADTFLANLAAFESTGQPLASWTTHTLGRNETLAQVAKRVDISEAKLREANRIPPRYRVAAGSVILIPRDETMDDDIAAKHLAASLALVPEAANLRQVTYKVRRGDTLNSVARRWNVQPDEITAWNNLRTPTLFAGQRLTLTVARAPAAKARARAQARPAARPAGAAKAAPARAAARPAATARPAAPARTSSARASVKPVSGKAPTRTQRVSEPAAKARPTSQRPARPAAHATQAAVLRH